MPSSTLRLSARPLTIERIADDVADGHARIERRERILEDEPHVAAVQREAAAVERGDIHVRPVAAAVAYRALAGLDGAQDQLSHGRLAGPAFTDDAEVFAGMKVEADVVHGADRECLAAEQALPGSIDLAEIAHREHRRRIARHGCDMPTLFELQRRGEQLARIGMLGMMEQRIDLPPFDEPSEAHHRDFVGDLRDDAHVVRDQEHGHAMRHLQPADQVEDLGLRRDVECRCRLVRDQDLGVAGQRHRDHRALPHAA